MRFGGARGGRRWGVGGGGSAGRGSAWREGVVIRPEEAGGRRDNARILIFAFPHGNPECANGLVLRQPRAYQCGDRA
jgi:hypothetical protein